jgi:hypothetical protein
MVEHEQVELQNVSGASADRGIAPLIDWLNARGCRTDYSCEGGPYEGWTEGPHVFPAGIGEAYISFVSAQDASSAVDELARLLMERQSPANLGLLARMTRCPWLTSDAGGPEPDDALWRWVMKVRLPGDSGWPKVLPQSVVCARFMYSDVPIAVAAIEEIPAIGTT